MMIKMVGDLLKKEVMIDNDGDDGDDGDGDDDSWQR